MVTNEPGLARLCRSMASQGRGDGAEWLNHVRLGYNYRMNELSAALGLAQMARIDEIVDARDRVARLYSDALGTSRDSPSPDRSGTCR